LLQDSYALERGSIVGATQVSPFDFADPDFCANYSEQSSCLMTIQLEMIAPAGRCSGFVVHRMAQAAELKTSRRVR